MAFVHTCIWKVLAEINLGKYGEGSELDMASLKSGYTAVVLCVLYKKDPNKKGSQWLLKNSSLPAMGRNFQEPGVLSALKSEAAKCVDPLAATTDGMQVLSLDKTFNMKKGEVGAIPASCDKLFVGLGWTCPGSLDLDASIVCLGSTGSVVSTVYWKKKNDDGIRHCGDNQTGDGAGDDEKIEVTLSEIKTSVASLHIVCNMFTEGASFERVSDAYIRLCTSAGNELARYELGRENKHRGVVFAKIYRQQGKDESGFEGWKIQALGLSCGGNTALQPGCTDVVCSGVAKKDVEYEKRGCSLM